MDKQKILIVDDDPDLRRGLNLRLRANHFDTAYATDGFSAIAMAQKERPDLIILDIGLPAGDGFVVLDRSGKQPLHSYQLIHRRIDISATEIRRRVAQRESISYLVPESVEEIVQRKKLYREQSQ